MSDNTQILMAQVGELKGQLLAMTQMIQSNHEATHQRINDFRHAVEGRIAGAEAKIERVDARVDSVEEKLHAHAVKAASGGAFSGAIAAAGIELIKFLAGR